MRLCLRSDRPARRGYQSIASGAPNDDLIDLTVPSIAAAGGELVTVVGKFFGFDPDGNGSATVVFDPGGSALPATIVGILDGTGTAGPSSIAHDESTSPLRSGEGLVIVTPAFPGTGVFDLEVSFDSGATLSIPVTVSSPGVSTIVYTMADDGFLPHALSSNVITFGGVGYTEFLINSNGYLSFAVGSTDWTPAFSTFFAGIQTAPTSIPNPVIAIMYSDLNRFGVASGGSYVVEEDSVSGSTKITIQNQNYWTSIEPAGTASVTCNADGIPGLLRFDHSQILFGTTSTDDVLVGVTDGDDSVGSDTGLDLERQHSRGLHEPVWTRLLGPDLSGQHSHRSRRPARRNLACLGPRQRCRSALSHLDSFSLREKVDPMKILELTRSLPGLLMLTIVLRAGAQTNGPDMVVTVINNPIHLATVGDHSVYSVSTGVTNIGNVTVEVTVSTPQHPVIAMNLFRYRDGRMEQIGQSWLKHMFAAAGPGCNHPNSWLNPGCTDVYGAGLNGSQALLGPRTEGECDDGSVSVSLHRSAGAIDTRSPAARSSRRPRSRSESRCAVLHRGQLRRPG